MPNIQISDDARKEIISWLKTIAFAVVLALIISRFVIVNAEVPSGSMKNTINENSRIVAFRMAYLLSEPERFDIVVFRYPDDETVLYVKRIIGMPGDKLEIRDGRVYINDSEEPLADDFVRGTPYGSSGPYYVPDGSYFMMGDNRSESEDSRRWKNTFVEKGKILGKVIFSYYPEPKLIK